MRGGSYLNQLYQSLRQEFDQLLALDRCHCSVCEECAIEMFKKINIYSLFEERDASLSVHHVWLWDSIDDIQPVRCKMSQSFDITNMQNVFDRSRGAAEGWLGR